MPSASAAPTVVVVPGEHIVACIELTIPLPYGHLAAKWWGRRDRRPVVCLHGWQDNAGSFDTLVPLLPDHVGYLCIDLPGHGWSSAQPQPTAYGHIQYLYALHHVFRSHFRWPRVSLLGHSMSSVLTFVYAALFDDYVDLAIGLDGLKPRHATELSVRMALGNANGAWLQWLLQPNEPPTYAYDELIERMVQATGGSVTRETAPYLLQRGTTPSRTQPDRFYFNRDNRVKLLNDLLLSRELNRTLAERIRCPYLFVKALDSPFTQNRADYQEVLEVMERSNPLFELYGIEGGHHVHLTEPKRVAAKVAPFVRKYRPDVDEPFVAKL